jgi:hypothetical protein
MIYDDIISELIKIEVNFAQVVRRHSEQILSTPVTETATANDLDHPNYQMPSRLLIHLFSCEHNDNPLYGEQWCADLAMNMVDRWAERGRVFLESKGKVDSREWPPYVTAEAIRVLGDRVDEERRSKWLGYLKAWKDLAFERPYGFTSPNHEAWRQVALYHMGKVFDKPEWSEMGHFLCKQELAYQTEEGFWEEGVHHGPSMKYNSIMIHPLAWMYRWTGDEEIGDAVRKLAEFMVTYTFPDGTTVGAFDGRQSTSLAFFAPVCPGLELVPGGNTLNMRGIELWKETGMADTENLIASSMWYAYFNSCFLGDAGAYYAETSSETEQESEPLRIDTDTVVRNHTTTFDGLMVRKGEWALALSSQNSDGVRRGRDIFRLERESRIELWHEHARLVIGGGHSRYDVPFGYSNVILDTGFGGKSDFGIMDDVEDRARRSYYMPHAIESQAIDGVPELRFIFAHGTVVFSFNLADDKMCEINASWDIRQVQRLCIQLPLIVWHEAELFVDNKKQETGSYGMHKLSKELRTSRGPFNSEVTLEVPEEVPSKVHYPLEILRTYGDLPEDEEFEAIFCIAMASSQWESPPDQGEAQWKIKV